MLPRFLRTKKAIVYRTLDELPWVLQTQPDSPVFILTDVESWGPESQRKIDPVVADVSAAGDGSIELPVFDRLSENEVWVLIQSLEKKLNDVFNMLIFSWNYNQVFEGTYNVSAAMISESCLPT